MENGKWKMEIFICRCIVAVVRLKVYPTSSNRSCFDFRDWDKVRGENCNHLSI